MLSAVELLVCSMLSVLVCYLVAMSNAQLKTKVGAALAIQVLLMATVLVIKIA